MKGVGLGIGLVLCHGWSWQTMSVPVGLMNKDNFLLYTAVIFLLFKHDKSVGLVLIGLWLILNFGLITALLGTMSAYLLPLALLVLGAILYWLATR